MDNPLTFKELARSEGISKEEHAALVSERLAVRATGGRPPAVQPTRDILIQKGYDAITRLLPKVAGRLEKALDNEADPLHERAVDILAKRTIPIAFYESLSKREFKDEDEGRVAPRITINIGTATLPEVTTAEVIDVDSTERK